MCCVAEIDKILEILVCVFAVEGRVCEFLKVEIEILTNVTVLAPHNIIHSE